MVAIVMVMASAVVVCGAISGWILKTAVLMILLNVTVVLAVLGGVKILLLVLIASILMVIMEEKTTGI